MDKLAKLQYENPDMLYRYKGSVGVPVLEMVDNTLWKENNHMSHLKSAQ